MNDPVQTARYWVKLLNAELISRNWMVQGDSRSRWEETAVFIRADLGPFRTRAHAGIDNSIVQHSISRRYSFDCSSSVFATPENAALMVDGMRQWTTLRVDTSQLDGHVLEICITLMRDSPYGAGPFDQG